MELTQLRTAGLRLLSPADQPEAEAAGIAAWQVLRLPSAEQGRRLGAVLAALYEGQAPAVAALAPTADVPPELFAWSSAMPGRCKTPEAFRDCVRILHEQGALIEHGELLAACQRRFPGLEEPSIQSNSALNAMAHWALHWNCAPALEYFLSQGCRPGMPFADACAESSLDSLRVLHRMGGMPSLDKEEGKFLVEEAFCFAHMNRAMESVLFLSEAGYDEDMFPDDGERNQPM
ncbi:unnamed protein product [Effrenium voratum]|uniref:Ankyrin repeat protein n=1 Tax=Effrenium voratum TaxID=2562239 RepID=A0AA36IAK5_9DINO|nr:unnamed protein product [Effrenium voratum]